MDRILVSRLFDEYGSKEYIFYESGKFSNPLFILSEGFAETLSDDLNSLLDGKEFIIRELGVK